MNNLKDKITNICGIIFAICTAILTTSASGAVALPTWVNGVCGILVAITGGLIGYFTGKTPAGTTKTPNQIQAGNTEPVIPPKG
jgi:hypothetical protein